MRILAIRGANLASLAGRFEIDLTSPPLANAGLFAITGDTGAGKSTLLDAMCLALYGECPRLSAAGLNEDVPDVGEQQIKARDPRAIIRRGTAQGWAEVEFEAGDGLVYCARWSARRARDRAEGKFQQVSRSLTRMRDEVVIEQQSSQVSAQVEALSGLSYDQFRRTVLLAQGDFDAFLRAGSDDRAALLERVTGTGIYRDVSRQVFLRHDQAVKALAEIEARRQATPALAAEDRAALEAEQAQIAADLAGLAQEMAATTAALARHEAHSAAAGRLARAETAEAAAAAGVAAAADARAHLVALDAALALRPEAARGQAADAALEGLVAREAGLVQAVDAAAAELDQAQAGRDAALAGREAAEQQFKAFGPEWDRAAALDAQIATAEAELRRAETEQVAAGVAVSGARTRRDELAAGTDAAETAALAAREGIAALGGVGALAGDWDRVATTIAEREKARAAFAEAGAEQQQEEIAAGAARAALDGLAAAEAADRARQDRLRSEEARLASRRSGIADADPQARLGRLMEVRQALRDMARAAADHAGASKAQAEAEATIAAQRCARAALDAQIAAAEAEAGRQSALIRGLERPLDLAEAAVSEQAAALRRQLAPGEPCPVCGATEHPVHEDAALAAVAAELRGALEAARRGLEAARQAGDAAARDRVAADLALGMAQEAAGAAAQVIAAAERDFAATALAAGRGGLGDLHVLPETAGEAVAGALAGIEAEREATEALLAEDRDLAVAQAAARDALAGLDAARDTRRAQQETQARALSRAEAAAGLAGQRAAQLSARIAELEAEIGPRLAAAGRDLAGLDAAPDTELAALAGVVAAWNGHVAAEAEAVARMAKLAPEAAAAMAMLAAAERAATSAAGLVATRRAAMATLAEARAGLLDGEPTGQHRTRINDARSAAHRAFDAAETALAALRSRKAGLDATLESCRTAIGPARDAVKAAAEALDRQLAAAGLDRGTFARLLEEGEVAWAEIAAQLAGLDAALTGARALLAERQTELAELTAAGLPEETAEDLRAEARAQELRRDQSGGRRGEIAATLRADDATLARLAGLEAEIAVVRRERDTWAAVNAAVGSAGGQKFARIAQSVTLGQLVERANLQLAALKPRYSLQGGGEDLSLFIVDHDMGDERRSARSLSGGERFLVSLALALALSGMGGQGGLAATLFIDEGFGALDADSLDVAMDALEQLQAQGRTVGVISHVEAMKERIPVQLRVSRRGGGASRVELVSGV